jgi:SAM-dependent methyltransferase
MKTLPPGNILQNIYLKRKLKRQNWKNFIEIGSGNGYLSNILLNHGLVGFGCDLNNGACVNNEKLNQKFISKGLYKALNLNFLDFEDTAKYDLIISSMVIEHLEEEDLSKLIFRAKEKLNKNGSLLFFVPSSMKYWGIEDEIAGHVKRYEFEDFEKLANDYNLNIKEIHGLTYPVSNLLLNISNKLVKKAESEKLLLSQSEKTIYTGNRNVPFKTTFPSFLKIILNEFVMMPFHFWQTFHYKNKNALVICAELKLK